MAVSQQTPLQAYTASGASAVFAFSFQLLAAADMTVLVDGVAKTLGADFSTTTGLGGTVTLVTTPTAGQRVVLLRNSSITRSTDYQNNGDLLAAVVNADFDRLWLVLQELVFGSKASPTSVRAPAGEVLSELPVASSRASRVMAFDSSGNPIAIAGVDTGSAAGLALDLASTASSKGASLVSVQDAGNYFAGTTVEAALQQLAPGVFQAPWYFTKDSSVLLSLRNSTSGNIIQQWQDGTPGTATYFYRGLSIQTNSHSVQMGPATNGGSCDLLWQRSAVNADPAGNRFNITFEESTDRLLLSYATTASGLPAFDSWAEVKAGTSPTLTFPALAAQFNLGVGVKQRAAGGFEVRLIPTSSTVADLKQIGGAGTTFLSFRDSAMGFFGSAGTSRPNITGSRGGNVALANLLSALATLGLITDSTTV